MPRRRPTVAAHIARTLDCGHDGSGYRAHAALTELRPRQVRDFIDALVVAITGGASWCSSLGARGVWMRQMRALPALL